MAIEDRGPQLAAVVIFLLAFSCITVGLRCYTMGFILARRFMAEDWLAVVTLIFYIAYSVSALIAVHFGLGNQVINVSIENRIQALLYKWIGQVLYVLVAVLVKFIVSLFLLRICLHQRWQRVTIYTLLTVVALFNTFFIFVVIFQCSPVPFYWYRYTSNAPVTGHCLPHPWALYPTYASFLVNVLSDWTLALIPVSIVWNALMDLRTKASVVAVLAIGSVASMATVARIPYAKQLLSNPDYLYNFTDIAIWSTVEIGLGLSASSLATLKPLFRKLQIFGTTRDGSRGTRLTKNNTNNRDRAGSSTLQSKKRSMLPGAKGGFSEISAGSESQTDRVRLAFAEGGFDDNSEGENQTEHMRLQAVGKDGRYVITRVEEGKEHA